MRFKYVLFATLILLCCKRISAQHVQPNTQKILDKLDQLQLQNEKQDAISILEAGIKSTTSPADLAYLYAYQSSIYTAMDSLLLSKRSCDLSLESAEQSQKNTSLAVAYRAKAFLNNALNLPDAVVQDALYALKLVEKNEEDLSTQYHLNYLLYGAYSKWDDSEKMEHYIRQARYYAIKANNINLQTNVNNGLSSMYLARYKKNKERNLLDSSYHYLNRSFALLEKQPDKLSVNTYLITCINLANYYLEHSSESVAYRQQKAFEYLGLAEQKLLDSDAFADKWGNIFGIKSGFAKQKGDLELAEEYLLQGLSRLMSSNGSYFRLEYAINRDLADIALKKQDFRSALTYQQRAEDLLKKSFNEQQLFNAQKLEVQYETEKKDRELELLTERENFRKRQNYLYGGVAVALLFGLLFMFVSYHFRLRYSIEREKQLTQEKEDQAQQAAMQLRLEKEERARLKAEQELLDLRRQQLEKEALANSLIIDRKNDTLKQIQDKIERGEAKHIQKLIKEEMLLQTDFEDIKMQIQELHPDFLNRMNEKAIQKLTPLDLKYCTYLYLKMSTKQIAQALHIEPHSVRMFKYRLKQKFGLGKEDDLESFLEG
ncbi:hypothetical protein [Sphingobacterium tabacisoli]|uniref:Helix-turn-helix transcriptional regulator n=1 Tax=Sphingobacterium tabacisoli TaxID=2044855 RepID=A0ABW5L8D1_9SPHI|nr:hypothetical protein [Sphingobacterium tabacisoli]